MLPAAKCSRVVQKQTVAEQQQVASMDNKSPGRPAPGLVVIEKLSTFLVLHMKCDKLAHTNVTNECFSAKRRRDLDLLPTFNWYLKAGPPFS